MKKKFRVEVVITNIYPFDVCAEDEDEAEAIALARYQDGEECNCDADCCGGITDVCTNIVKEYD